MKRLLSLVMALAILLSLCPAAAAAGEEMILVSFGSYPKSEVAATQALAQAAYDENGDTELGGVRYRRLTDWDGTLRYFRWEPIVWQVVGDVLLARDVIDCKMFDEQEYRESGFMGGTAYCDPVPWEECSLRAFLMGEFRTLAFTEQEQTLIAEDATLFTVAQAKELGNVGVAHAYLPKRATEYAKAAGVKTSPSEYYDGDAEWLLKDISPITSTAVCTIGPGGGIDQGIRILLNEEGMGLVPCIRLTDWQSLDWWTEPMPEKKVTVYYPGGLIDVVTQARAEELVEQGWYMTKEEAKAASAEDMARRFEASPYAQLCDWDVYPRDGELVLYVNQLNMTPTEAAEFVKGMVDTFFTGKIEDYIYLRTYLCYDESYGSNLDEFRENIGKEVHDILATCFSDWGDMMTIGQYAAGQTSRLGWEFQLRIDLELNGNGGYSGSGTRYYETLTALVQEAKAYSDRPLGQLQYLRHYLGQNTVYDANLFSNSPSTLLNSGIGLCGSYANLVSDFCAVADIPCLVLSCGGASHAWNAVYLEGRWHLIDTTGSKDRDYMRDGYSSYLVDGRYYDFNPAGFPEEHTAENVSFLQDDQDMLAHAFGTEDCCSVTEEQYQFLQELFRPRPSDRFTDVPRDAWFAPYVDHMVENGFIQGVAADRFGPGTLATRGMVVTILHRQNGAPEAESAGYADVLDGQWYADAIDWAAQSGVVMGYSNGCFGPNDPITREQLATILWRNAGRPESSRSLENFRDADQIASYAVDAIRWCVESGILSGYTDGTLRSGNTATRAELAKMLTVYFGQTA